MEDILDEVRRLVERGVKEFQLIAQELTFYGEDLYGRQTIAELVDRMAQIPGVKWIRLHYAYPTKFPWDLLPVMARHANVCKYLDIALQHISDRVLERMKRNVTRQQTMELIARIRREVPGIHLRTTLLVGFPGETDEDFEELVAFVREVRFERMGAFAYSEEEGTYSAQHYVDDVPEDVKQSRLDRLMAVQQRISAQVEAQKVGQTLTTIIDRYEGGKGRQGHRHGGYYVGRTEFCSPEVDPEVLVKADEGDLKTGEFYQVRINDSEEFDLYGTIEDKGA
jgi:ribosomal protein S12 methylthiotransferase